MGEVEMQSHGEFGKKPDTIHYSGLVGNGFNGGFSICDGLPVANQFQGPFR